MPEEKQEGWEERFDEMWKSGKTISGNMVKDFIRSERRKAAQESIEVVSSHRCSECELCRSEVIRKGREYLSSLDNK